MKNEEIRYVVVGVQEDNTFEVAHIEDGPIMAGLSNFDAARTIAMLACRGFITRNDNGDLCLLNEPTEDDVETIEEYIDSVSSNSDDGPTQEEHTKPIYCAPPNRLEIKNGKE